MDGTVKHCVVCGGQLGKRRRRFCSNECKEEWHTNLLGLSVNLVPADESMESKKEKSPIAKVAEQARKNGRTYGKEAMQEYLVIQRQKMMDDFIAFQSMKRQKQAVKMQENYGERT